MGIYRREKRSEQQNPNFISRVSSPEKISPSTAKNNSPSLTSVETQLQRAKEGFDFAKVDITPSPKAFPQPIQRKVEVGKADDKYEQEADRVASQAVKSTNTPQNNSLQQKPSNQSIGHNNQENILNEALQRQSPVRAFVTTRAIQARQEENVGQPFDMTKNKFINSSVVQKRPDIDVKPMRIPLQRIQRRSDFAPGGVVNSQFEQNLTRAKTGGQPLDTQLQRKMGNAIGADFSPVRIHQDHQADHLSRSIQAKAFTTGNHIFFKKGEYNPSSESGQELIAHELTHTVQQRAVVQRKPAETSNEEQNQVPQIQRQTEQNPPKITPQRMDTTQRATETIQRAVSLEMDFPIPVDNLYPEDVDRLREDIDYYKKDTEKADLSWNKYIKKSKLSKFYKGFPKWMQIKRWRNSLIKNKKEAFADHKKNNDKLSKSKLGILKFIQENGKAKKGVNWDPGRYTGFKICVDHDDRVKGNEFPPLELGGNSHLRIVTYPLHTDFEFKRVMGDIDAYIIGLEGFTDNLTKRYEISGNELIEGIGPFAHPLYPRSKQSRHNRQATVKGYINGEDKGIRGTTGNVQSWIEMGSNLLLEESLLNNKERKETSDTSWDPSMFFQNPNNPLDQQQDLPYQQMLSRPSIVVAPNNYEDDYEIGTPVPKSFRGDLNQNPLLKNDPLPITTLLKLNNNKRKMRNISISSIGSSSIDSDWFAPGVNVNNSINLVPPILSPQNSNNDNQTSNEQRKFSLEPISPSISKSFDFFKPTRHKMTETINNNNKARLSVSVKKDLGEN